MCIGEGGGGRGVSGVLVRGEGSERCIGEGGGGRGVRGVLVRVVECEVYW